MFRATRVGRDTVLAQIVQMVQAAQGSKAPIQRLADQVSARFVPVVMVLAAGTFAAWLLVGPPPAFTHGLVAAISVLIIACPCAMGLATPTAIMVGTGRAAESGILFKGEEALEQAGRVDTAIFDKTGTLTLGKPSVADVVAFDGTSEDEVLALAAAVERGSEHPLGAAIVAEATRRAVAVPQVTQFESVPGRGVVGVLDGGPIAAGNPAFIAERGIDMAVATPAIESSARDGRTPILVAWNGRLVGLIAVTDPVKPEASAAVRELKALGIVVWLVTGDSRAAADAVARQIGIEHVIAEVLPAEKAARVRDLQAIGRRVAMVGDGINDAPALAQADLGVAIGTGTDVAIEASDVTLVGGDPRLVASAIRLSRQTVRVIRENLVWAFGYNVVLIPVAMGVLYAFFGLLLDPGIAAGAMALSSVSVVLNSLRLLRFDARPTAGGSRGRSVADRAPATP